MDTIVVNNFYKSYGKVEAVRGVSFSVQKGELFGLIGPDGAGKTTLIRTICTLITPTSGTILVLGKDVNKNPIEIRKIIGYMPQQFSLYPDLTVQQNLNFFADLFQVPDREKKKRLRQLYQFSKLAPFKNRRAADLSGGMQQKLALSCALIHTPEVLVLDEPTYGVDPLSRQELWEILHTIQKEGATILVSTAYMDEAEHCDRVALFFKGKIVGLGTPDDLKQRYRFPLFKVDGQNLRDLQNFFKKLKEVRTTQMFGSALHVSFTRFPDEKQWLKWQEATQGNLISWQNYQPAMEDVFLELMETSET